MTLDEAIRYCKEVAEGEEVKAKRFADEYPHTKIIESCIECAEEHKQLAYWLMELKAYRELFDSPEDAKRQLDEMCMV